MVKYVGRYQNCKFFLGLCVLYICNLLNYVFYIDKFFNFTFISFWGVLCLILYVDLFFFKTQILICKFFPCSQVTYRSLSFHKTALLCAV